MAVLHHGCTGHTHLSCAPKLQQNHLEEACHQEVQLVSVGVAVGERLSQSGWESFSQLEEVMNDREATTTLNCQVSRGQDPGVGLTKRRASHWPVDLQGFV